jgi:hypothetical protein
MMKITRGRGNNTMSISTFRRIPLYLYFVIVELELIYTFIMNMLSVMETSSY